MSIEPGDRVLDVFAGSGALGINAALRGATAVTVDISASAVICARKNAKLNSVEERTDVRWGDLHSCLNGSEKFDVVVANPPLLPGPQPDSLSMAVFDPNLRSTVDFVHGVGEYLHDASTCYLLTSSVIEFSGISLEDEIHASGLTSRVVKSSNFGYETYRVREIRLI
jgi:methylase of polypeptide subunit release factors